MSKFFKGIFFIFIALFLACSLYAEEKIQVNIIFDASNSMWGQINGKSKIEIAVTAMNDLLNGLEKKKNINTGLRVYGHLNKRCDNSVQEIKPGPGNIEAIRKFIAKIKPHGKTPIAYSLKEAANDFNKNIKGAKIIILITDGLESCNGDPCSVAQALKKAGIVSKIHIVGFGMDKNNINALKCIAKPFGGKVIGASNAGELVKAFKEITKDVSVKNNLEIRGLDKNNQAHIIKVKIFENGKLIQETQCSEMVSYLKPGKYSIKAKSAATGVIITKNAEILKNKITKIDFVFKHGFVKLNCLNSKGKNVYARYKIINSDKKVIKTEGENNILQELAPGTYDIEATDSAVERVQWKRGVEVKSGKTTDVLFTSANAELELRGVDSKGNNVYTIFHIFNAGTDKEVGSDEGEGSVKIKIKPGHYDIKAYYSETKMIVWQRGVKLDGGSLFKKQFKFEQSEIELCGTDKNNKNIYTIFHIFNAGTNKEVGFDEGENCIKITILPGKYDIQAEYPDTKTIKWHRGVEIKSGKSFKKSFIFSFGKIVLKGVNGSNNIIYTVFHMYNAGTDKEVRFNEGENTIEFTVLPGRYDIKATDPETKKVKWLRGIELKDGEVLEKTIKF